MSWQKVEALLAALFIFSLPFETRIVLFAADPFNEWQSVFLYASDVLFIVLLFSSLFSMRKLLKSNFNSFRSKPFILAAILVIFAALATLIGNNHLPQWYHVIKIAEGVLLFYYAALRLPGILSQKRVIWLLVGTGVVQSVIGFAQFAKQSSLGLRIFRESPLVVGNDAVAQIMVDGARMIRAYGTTPSPNVLAGFLAVVIILSFILFFAEQKSRNKQFIIIFLQSLLIGGLFLTFSRGALAIFLAVSIVGFSAMIFAPGMQEKRSEVSELILCFVLYVTCYMILFWPELIARAASIDGGDGAAIGERYLFNVVGIEAIKQHPLWGVGLGNFTSYFRATFPYLRDSLYQPIHSIYLLIAAEGGIPTAFAFVLFLGTLIGGAINNLQEKQYGARISSLFTVLCLLFIVLVGMIDHYFLTIQQTNLFFWLVAGLAVQYILQNKRELV